MTREEMEQAIIRNAVYELTDHGLAMSVDRGGDEYEVIRSRDPDALLAALDGADDVRLVAAGLMGWVHFLRGGKGWDVVCDMTVSLEPYLPETLALAETYREQEDAR